MKRHRTLKKHSLYAIHAISFYTLWQLGQAQALEQSLIAPLMDSLLENNRFDHSDNNPNATMFIAIDAIDDDFSVLQEFMPTVANESKPSTGSTLQALAVVLAGAAWP